MEIGVYVTPFIRTAVSVRPLHWKPCATLGLVEEKRIKRNRLLMQATITEIGPKYQDLNI